MSLCWRPAPGAGWSKPELAPITPVKGEMIALEPPPGVELPDQVIWGNGIYAVPRDGRLLIGATVEMVGLRHQHHRGRRATLAGQARKI